jgi:TonB family protein
LLAGFGIAGAQQPVAPEPPSMSQRVLRDADSPMRWIKIQSESVRKAAAPAALASSASPAVAPPPATKTASTKAVPPKLRVAPTATPTRDATAGTNPQLASSAAPASAPPHADNTTVEALDNIDRADPEWDEDVMRRLRHGRVVVRFNVAEDGYLSRIQIVESSNSRLTGPVMGALMQWRFQPIAEPRVATVEFGFDLDSGRR